MPSALGLENLKSFQKNGSWPYFPGNRPSTEPTVACAIACSSDDSVCEGALDFLMKIRNPDGGWSSGESLGDSDWNTGMALFGINKLSTALKSRKRISRELEEKVDEVYKQSLSKLASLRADVQNDTTHVIGNAIFGAEYDYPRGWPWEQNTYHWVEPTAYSLLAIKCGPLTAEKRYANAIEQGNSYLFEKTCKAGGWNWGQTRTLGFDFPPVVRDTALGLISLQDQKQNDHVKRALEVLRAAKGGGTNMPEPLAILALDAYGDNVSDIVELLVKNYKSPEFGGDNLVSLAYATMAAQLQKNGNGLKFEIAPETVSK